LVVQLLCLEVPPTRLAVRLMALLADAVLLLHLAFVVFVMMGGALALRWPRVAWIHLPAAAWGATVEFAGLICPLTPLEDRLRAAAGEVVAGGDFMERLLLPLLYPDWLTRETQLVLGGIVVALNAAIYAFVLARCRPLRCRRA
jgi:hypothetical protein